MRPFQSLIAVDKSITQNTLLECLVNLGGNETGGIMAADVALLQGQISVPRYANTCHFSSDLGRANKRLRLLFCRYLQ
jgi:hypothetical protein